MALCNEGEEKFELVEFRELRDADSLRDAIRVMCAPPPGAVTHSEKLARERKAGRKARRKKNKAIQKKLRALDERFFSK